MIALYADGAIANAAEMHYRILKIHTNLVQAVVTDMVQI